MKKINLKGLNEVLSDKELKSVIGSSGQYGPGSCCCVTCYNENPPGILSSCSGAYEFCGGAVAQADNCYCPGEDPDKESAYLKCMAIFGSEFMCQSFL